jgi:hypothetical protein
MRSLVASQPKYESPVHRAVRKMIAQKMRIGRPFVTHEGKMVYPVNDYLLTTEQILELDSKRELTSWGIREYAEQLAKKTLCPVHQIEMRETAELDVPGLLFFYCPQPDCDRRYSKMTGHITINDLPSR